MNQSPQTITLRPWLAAAILLLAGLAAYANSFTVPFVYDDMPAIAENPAIRRLWPLGEVLFPAQVGGMTTSGRPLVGLSLAVNYALTGDRVWSYHVFNLFVHLGAGLALWGVMRRTWAQPPLRARFGAAAEPLALLTAMLWVVHPLQTEAVTYTVQRAESLMGFFFLLTLYAFIRAAGAPAQRRWPVLCIGACLAGIASKEVTALAPLIALLYDRTFIAGGFVAAWRARRRLYLGLAATWIPLALLLLTTGGNRGGTVGFDIGVPWTRFWLTQFEAVCTYLRLSLWPYPLVFDYGRNTALTAGTVLPYALVVVALLVLTGWALRHRPVAGFVGAWVFVLLAPTSLVPSAVQLIVEHRMYLPLAAICALLVGGLYRVLGRRGLWVAGAAALAGTGLTFARNADYASDLVLWADSVVHRPDNEVALSNLGLAYSDRDREEEAIACYRRALAVNPRHTEAHYNLATSLSQLGRTEEAVAEYEAALRLAPDFAAAHNNLGTALLKLGRRDEAAAQYREAARLDPALADAPNNLGNLLLQEGRATEAVEAISAALRIRPDFAAAHYNLGNAFAQLGRMAEAEQEYVAALRLQPRYPDARVNLGNVLLQREDLAGARREYERVLETAPDLPVAHNNLGNVLLQQDHPAEAVAHFERALQGDPSLADAHRGAGHALALLGRVPEAIAHYEAYLRLVPDDAAAREELAQLRAP